MNKFAKAFLASLMIAPAAANAAVVQMNFLGTDVSGDKHFIEKTFGCYANGNESCQYKGATWKIIYRSGKIRSAKVYFDCSDATWGMSTPTVDDIDSGTVGYAMYELACGKDQ